MTVEDRTFTTRESTWQRSYAKRLFLSDLLVLIVAAFLSQSLWIGNGNVRLALDAASPLAFPVTYTVVSLVVVALWMLFLDFYAAREHKNLGSGTTEYKRIADSTMYLMPASRERLLKKAYATRP